MSVQSVMHVADAGQAILPAEVPMSMPEQSFRDGRLQVPRQRTAPRLMALRRLYILGGTAAMTIAATVMMWKVLAMNGISVLEACLLVLFVALFAWIALSFSGAVAGFLTAVFDRATSSASTRTSRCRWSTPAPRC